MSHIIRIKCFGCGKPTVFAPLHGKNVLWERDDDGLYVMIEQGGRIFFEEWDDSLHANEKRYAMHKYVCPAKEMFVR